MRTLLSTFESNSHLEMLFVLLSTLYGLPVRWSSCGYFAWPSLGRVLSVLRFCNDVLHSPPSRQGDAAAL